MNNYKYIYIYDHYCVYLHAKKTARTLNKSQSCVYFSVIFRHLPWPEESETASSLWHQHSSLGWKKEHRPTPGSSWQETRRGNLEICTEKSCWCYVFMIVLVRFVTSNDLWNLWTSMDFSGLLWTSIGFMFSYVFICFHMFSYVFIACAWLARLIFIGSRLIQIQQVLMQFCCRVPVGRCKCFYQ